MLLYELEEYNSLKKRAAKNKNAGDFRAVKEYHKRLFAYDLAYAMRKANTGGFPEDYCAKLCVAMQEKHGSKVNRVVQLLKCYFDRCSEYDNGVFAQEQKTIKKYLKKCRGTLVYSD